MASLVDEMREAAEFGGYEHDCPHWQGLLRAGADEIERLRSEVVGAVADPDLLLGGEHEGPCINFDGQDPEQFDEYDSCSRHIAAFGKRRERLANVVRRAQEIASRSGEQPPPTRPRATGTGGGTDEEASHPYPHTHVSPQVDESQIHASPTPSADDVL
jgi:hypothetical protein